MKNRHLLLILSIGVFIISCRSDDDLITNNTQKLFKKVERIKNGNLFFETTVNYHSNNRIQSIVTIKHNPASIGFNRVISTRFSGNSISSIRDEIDYVSQNSTDEDITYDVTFESNLVLLTSETIGIEIAHTNGFVDSIKEYRIEDSAVIREAYLTRDRNQNLTSITFSNGNVVNSYSDFDSDKEADPYSIVIDVMNPEYIVLFDLKLTANNPHTSSQSILGSTGTPLTYSYDYDDDGHIIKTNDPNLDDYMDTFYVEQ